MKRAEATGQTSDSRVELNAAELKKSKKENNAKAVTPTKFVQSMHDLWTCTNDVKFPMRITQETDDEGMKVLVVTTRLCCFAPDDILEPLVVNNGSQLYLQFADNKMLFNVERQEQMVNNKITTVNAAVGALKKLLSKLTKQKTTSGKTDYVYTSIIDLPKKVKSELYKTERDKVGYCVYYVLHHHNRLLVKKQLQAFLVVRMIISNQKKYEEEIQSEDEMPVEGLD